MLSYGIGFRSPDIGVLYVSFFKQEKEVSLVVQEMKEAKRL